MCIRDSIKSTGCPGSDSKYSETVTLSLLCHPGEEAGGEEGGGEESGDYGTLPVFDMAVFSNGKIAVSYTHLDVYKRQGVSMKRLMRMVRDKVEPKILEQRDERNQCRRSDHPSDDPFRFVVFRRQQKKNHAVEIGAETGVAVEPEPGVELVRRQDGRNQGADCKDSQGNKRRVVTNPEPAVDYLAEGNRCSNGQHSILGQGIACPCLLYTSRCV